MSQTLQEQVPSFFVVCSTTPIRNDEKGWSEKEKISPSPCFHGNSNTQDILHVIL